MIYVNVESPNLGFPYFNFFWEAQCKKTPCIWLLLVQKTLCSPSPCALWHSNQRTCILRVLSVSAGHVNCAAKPPLSPSPQRQHTRPAFSHPRQFSNILFQKNNQDYNCDVFISIYSFNFRLGNNIPPTSDC